MKQMFKNTLVIVTLLLVSMGAANSANKFIYKLDGVEITNSADYPGIVSFDSEGSVGTITITPNSGYYFSLDDPNDLIVKKLIDGSNAQTRNPAIDTPLGVNAKDATADPSKTTEYQFELPGAEYEYEFTINFHTRTSVDNADVTVKGGPFTYSGSPIMPDLTVTVGGKTLTKDTDYKAYYKDSINAGVNTGKVIIEGIRKYNGSKGYWGGDTAADNPAATYTINKAEISPVVEITGWTYGSSANAPSPTFFGLREKCAPNQSKKFRYLVHKGYCSHD